MIILKESRGNLIETMFSSDCDSLNKSKLFLDFLNHKLMTNQKPKQTLPKLWAHQQDAILNAKNHYALFFDPGCGKSRTVIEIYKKNNPVTPFTSAQAVLILAPLNVCRNWENELALYMDRPYKSYVVAGQSKPKKLKVIEQFKHDFYTVKKHPAGERSLEFRDPMFLICNIETLRSPDFLKELKKCGLSFIIVDESHNFKTATSLQTKGLIALESSLRPRNLYLLTGTPAPQGEVDLWSTFKLLKRTDDIFFIWRKKHFNDLNERRRGTHGYWPNYTISPESKDSFQKLLKECSATARKNEVLDLPELIRTTIYNEMSKEQARNYDTMKEYLFAIDSEGNELNASNLLTRTLRLQQILAGFLSDESPIKGHTRLDALKSAIELTNGEAFLIWTIFKATYRQIASLLDDMGISFAFLTGEQSADERFQNMEDFQAGKLRCLIAHPRAGGVGVNLTAASYSIHYTRNFNLVDDLQCEARNYRGGSEIHNRITRIDIVTANTIDEQITQSLREKKTVQDFILGLKG